MQDFIPDWHDTGSCMDLRHIRMVHSVLVVIRPERTLEIGGYSGCSSSAFVAAGVPDAHFAEISPSERFLSVVRDNGTIHQRKGCDVIASEPPFDVVLVDGAHDMQSVSEELAALLENTPRVIIAHDVKSSDHGYPHCEGAAYLMSELARLGWHMLIDAEHRQGECTHRGVMFTTRDPELMPLIAEAVRQWISIEPA